MIRAPLYVFWLINMFVVFGTGLKFISGSRYGGIRAFLDSLIGLACTAAAYFLTGMAAGRFLLWPRNWTDSIFALIWSLDRNHAQPYPGLNDFALDLCQKMISALLYFILFTVILSLLTGFLKKKYKEKLNQAGSGIRRVNYWLGGIGGVLSFSIFLCFVSPVLISAETAGIVGNGKQLVYNTFLQFPVNIIGRPSAHLLGKSLPFMAGIYDDGFPLYGEEMQEMVDWCVEYSIYEFSADRK